MGTICPNKCLGVGLTIAPDRPPLRRYGRSYPHREGGRRVDPSGRQGNPNYAEIPGAARCSYRSGALYRNTEREREGIRDAAGCSFPSADVYRNMQLIRQMAGFLFSSAAVYRSAQLAEFSFSSVSVYPPIQLAELQLPSVAAYHPIQVGGLSFLAPRYIDI